MQFPSLEDFMQVRLYRDGENLVVDIPNSDTELSATVPFQEVGEAFKSKPVILTMPDPTTNTQYQRPLGELPVRIQEQFRADQQEALDTAARNTARDSQKQTPVEELSKVAQPEGTEKV